MEKPNLDRRKKESISKIVLWMTLPESIFRPVLVAPLFGWKTNKCPSSCEEDDGLDVTNSQTDLAPNLKLWSDRSPFLLRSTEYEVQTYTVMFEAVIDILSMLLFNSAPAKRSWEHSGEPVEGWDQISIESKRGGAIMEGWAFWAAHWTGSCNPRKNAVSIDIIIQCETRWFLPSNTIVKRARKKIEVRIRLNSAALHSLVDMIENLQR